MHSQVIMDWFGYFRSRWQGWGRGKMWQLPWYWNAGAHPSAWSRIHTTSPVSLFRMSRTGREDQPKGPLQGVPRPEDHPRQEGVGGSRR